MILHIILNIAGVIPVNFNDEQIYGVTGVVVIIGFSPFVVLTITTLIYLGLMCGFLVLKGIKSLTGNGGDSIPKNTF